MKILSKHDRTNAWRIETRAPVTTASSSAPAQRGVALVITLILLAVITTLAIAFLALTYRETAAVDSLGRTTDSELACESGRQRAITEIFAPFARNDTNKFNGITNGVETMGPDFMVSVGWHTNRLLDDPNTPGFNELTNQFLNPTPPVFVNTNRANGPANAPFEDRFYLDLNRNRHFEETGYVPVTTDAPSTTTGYGFDFQRDTRGFIVTNWLVGDPQWIGILQDPRRPHGPDNRFIARYAYLVQPIGRSLDMNWVHNQAIDNRAAGRDAYYRNQGVGGWEVNLAAFLADLNTNEWNNPLNLPYSYTDNPLFNQTSGEGLAFIDARALVNYRYDNNRTRLNTVNELFPLVAASFRTDQIDAYANGFTGPPGNPNVDDDPSLPWPGSASRRHYFSVHDLWGKLPDPLGFTNQLMRASTRGNSYDRYTYYRTLSQMGTDSAEEEDGKVNINYVNIPSWVDPTIRYRATDLVPWTITDPASTFVRNMGRPGPELFFLTVATNLFLREPDLAFIVTNARPTFNERTNQFGIPLRIPIYTNRAFGGLASTITTNGPIPGPLYAGRIHQILQLAANIYDATTGSKSGEPWPYFPSVFRPQFETVNGNVYITNYTLVTDTAGVRNTPWRDLDAGETVSGNDLVYGIPLVIGARKGFPAFSEIGVVTIADATRKLSLFRAVTNGPITSTNQNFRLNVITRVQVEARNPYQASNPRPIELLIGMRNVTVATNSFVRFPFTGNTNGYSKTYVAGEWPGETDPTSSTHANHVISPTFQHTILDWTTNTPPERGGFTNQWAVAMTNRMLFFLIDRSPVAGAAGRIVDCVTLRTPTNHLDIAALLEKDLENESQPLSYIWNSAPNGQSGPNSGISRGIYGQMTVSKNKSFTADGVWGNYLNTPSKDGAIDAFNAFLASTGPPGVQQVPFTPTRRIVQRNFYQVSDPLVHYTLEDLRPDTLNDFCDTVPLNGPSARTNLADNLGKINKYWFAWNKGTVEDAGATAGLGTLNPTLRDPGLLNSDAWDFPTNRFPNIGWLGRVHRGSPWQTIYLKSSGPTENWTAHSGPFRHDYSAALMRPVRDWELVDIFTTAPHPNATRGRLSVNQTNLAAWSAVLSGAVTTEPIPHPDDATYTAASSLPMPPAAISPQIELIVAGINHQRTNLSAMRYKYLNGDPYLFAPFNKLSDLLSTPELSDGSPFLNVDPNRFDGHKPVATAIITDADYERIPQQILSLVKLGEPRFVVYAWGQSLKPARRNPEDNGPSIVTSGPDKGMCRNYQITGEMATRAVIRIEFDRITDTRSPQYNQFDYSRPRAVVESFNILPVE